LDQADLEGWALIFGAEEEADLLILGRVLGRLLEVKYERTKTGFAGGGS